MVIIAILMAMLMPAIMRAFQKAKGMSEEIESYGVFELLLKSTRHYCARSTNYQFNAKADFADKCNLPVKCRDWIGAGTTVFVPFNYLDSTDKVVLTFHYGRNRAELTTFTKGDLSIWPN